MNKLIVLSILVGFSLTSFAGLKPGDSIAAYQIRNAATGKEYCQVCAYGGMPGKIIAFGKLEDKAFWKDLRKLEKLHQKNGKKLGIFAHVIDSDNRKAVHKAATKNKITFPVVLTAEEDWNRKYKVDGVSRTIYYTKGVKVAWTHVGLDADASSELTAAIKKDL